jgi:hypothetical protein
VCLFNNLIFRYGGYLRTSCLGVFLTFTSSIETCVCYIVTTSLSFSLLITFFCPFFLQFPFYYQRRIHLLNEFKTGNYRALDWTARP